MAVIETPDTGDRISSEVSPFGTLGMVSSTPGLTSVHVGTWDPTLVEPSLDAARSELGLGGRQLF